MMTALARPRAALDLNARCHPVASAERAPPRCWPAARARPHAAGEMVSSLEARDPDAVALAVYRALLQSSADERGRAGEAARRVAPLVAYR